MVERKPSASGQGSASTPSRRAASPYGTRSRRGAGRINYAEDKDDVMDFEMTTTAPVAAVPSTQTTTTTTANTITNNTTNTTTTSTNGTSNGSTSGAGAAKKHAASATPVVKEAASTTTTTTSTKKRKAAHPPPPPPPPPKQEQHTVEVLSNMPYFEKPFLGEDGSITSSDGLKLSPNDHIYLVCEPPGEPYYLARIMEFLHTNNDLKQPIDSIRVNWYYRPRDIQKKLTDSRQVYATMHSDTCPLASVRGHCTIMHKANIKDFDEYRKQENSFWFEKMFDRYIHRFYDVIPTRDVLNVPEKVRKCLLQRWSYIIVEPNRAKELTSQVKNCRRCSQYCPSQSSVRCAVCDCTYHMNCVQPPLLKKPSRGFAWACGPCNRAQERRLEARNHDTTLNEEDLFDEDDEDLAQAPAGDTSPTPSEAELNAEPTPEQLALSRQWPYRYLGQHCQVEDVFDYDDRIYPRASSRIGARHQAVVLPWYGHPVQYRKPLDIPKKTKGKHKKDAKALAAQAALDAEVAKRENDPKWIQDEPPGYTVRGGEDTSKLLFTIPEEVPEKKKMTREELVEDYMERAKKLASTIGVEPFSVNFLDKALNLLYKNKYNAEAALKQLKGVDRVKDLNEPEFSEEELRLFEEGVSKYGSELHSVAKHCKKEEAQVVRFYYMWKKTPNGHKIWGNYEGRRHKKEAKLKENASKLVDDVADDRDDSAFDGNKAVEKKRGFQCKFCNTRTSRQWRRAPGVAPGTLIHAKPEGRKHSKNDQDRDKMLVLALCQRCGELWRRYGLQYEDVDELMKKVGAGGGRGKKRVLDEEYMKMIAAAQEAKSEAATRQQTPVRVGTPTGSVPAASVQPHHEPPKKKTKTETPVPTSAPATKKGHAKEKKESAQPVKIPTPEPPKPLPVPCAVCLQIETGEPNGGARVTCRECKLAVHKSCYGVGQTRGANKWLCDMCSNDKNPTFNTTYQCVYCPVGHDNFVDKPLAPIVANGQTPAPPKEVPTKGKKKEKEKEKEKTEEKGKGVAAVNGQAKGKEVAVIKAPTREALKVTSQNNWGHVICSVWHQEIRFGDADSMRSSEGIMLIPQNRWAECTLCHVEQGPTLPCHNCHAMVHVSCAQRSGYILGFEITPVKGSRKDSVTTITLGKESGVMTPVIYCPTHTLKTTVHPMFELVPDSSPSQIVLELYVRKYKQADLSLTGTVRKANYMTLATKHARNPGSSTGHKASVSGASGRAETDPDTPMPDARESEKKKERCCSKCGTDVSPIWRKTGAPADKVKKESVDVDMGLDEQPDSTATQVNGDSDQSPEVKYVCHACYWKSSHEPDPAEEPVVELKKMTDLPPLRIPGMAPPPPPVPPPQVLPPTLIAITGTPQPGIFLPSLNAQIQPGIPIPPSFVAPLGADPRNPIVINDQPGPALPYDHRATLPPAFRPAAPPAPMYMQPGQADIARSIIANYPTSHHPHLGPPTATTTRSPSLGVSSLMNPVPVAPPAVSRLPPPASSSQTPASASYNPSSAASKMSIATLSPPVLPAGPQPYSHHGVPAGQPGQTIQNVQARLELEKAHAASAARPGPPAPLAPPQIPAQISQPAHSVAPAASGPQAIPPPPPPSLVHPVPPGSLHQNGHPIPPAQPVHPTLSAPPVQRSQISQGSVPPQTNPHVAQAMEHRASQESNHSRPGTGYGPHPALSGPAITRHQPLPAHTPPQVHQQPAQHAQAAPPQSYQPTHWSPAKEADSRRQQWPPYDPARPQQQHQQQGPPAYSPQRPPQRRNSRSGRRASGTMLQTGLKVPMLYDGYGQEHTRPPSPPRQTVQQSQQNRGPIPPMNQRPPSPQAYNRGYGYNIHSVQTNGMPGQHRPPSPSRNMPPSQHQQPSLQSPTMMRGYQQPLPPHQQHNNRPPVGQQPPQHSPHRQHPQPQPLPAPSQPPHYRPEYHYRKSPPPSHPAQQLAPQPPMVGSVSQGHAASPSLVSAPPALESRPNGIHNLMNPSPQPPSVTPSQQHQQLHQPQQTPQQHHQNVQQAPLQSPAITEKRRASGASGSPALANLLH
ncbi:hypothetical protein BJ508DRAFT_171590 [Ascobolus immersus RN42]|uniref:BAH-domain-containing protein n=1 Tax=Ascobolus immersus RN42 TaxID=1160509 RepID=A0A3N4HUE3_ASCIM|nr:hypothetical protein BJ508DRAFT_171590 [Ascobolus immersus RN42]